MIGTVDEAKEIFDFYTARQWDEDFSVYHCPDGWEYIGDGSSRIAYLAPSGVVYKVQRYADEAYNHQEHSNFEHIRKSGSLPMGWRVPESWLHTFATIIVGFDYQTKKPLPAPGVVAVIALEFVKGRPVGYDDFMVRAEMLEGMEKMGLFDGARGNTLRTEDGFCIVDAGEGYLNQNDYDEAVSFAKVA